MEIVIDGSNVKSESDLHASLAIKLELSGYYGRNLDALWDVLSMDIERPLTLIWDDANVSKQYLGDTFDKIINIFERVKKQDEEWGLDERFDYQLN